jgi:hypothetical protein
MDPKPGGERVKQGHVLMVAVLNLTDKKLTVRVEFSEPMEDGKQDGRYSIPVPSQETRSRAIPLHSKFFGRRFKNADVIRMPYEVSVDGVVLDPDLEIER